MVILPSRRKNFTSQTPSGDSDPYWNNVTFLSKFDETGLGLGIFRDVSPNPSNVTRATTNVVLNTAGVPAPKFGAGNIYFTNATSSANTTANLSKFLLTNQEWTVEGWFVPLGIPGLNGRAVFTVSNFCRITSSLTTGLWSFTTSLNNFATAAINIAANVQLNTGAWNHIAIQRMRNVNTFRYDAYLNGVFVGTTSNSGNHGPGGTTSGLLQFAAGGTNNSLAFMADEIRVTSGVARYATGANFTPPTQPYPTQ